MEEEMQKKYAMLQYLQQQAAALMNEKNMIDERIGEINTTIHAMEKLEGIKPGEEMWSSIGSSSFVRSCIKDTEKFLVAVGSGIALKKSREGAIAILRSRLSDMEKAGNEIIYEINNIAVEAERLEKRLAEMLQGQSGRRYA